MGERPEGPTERWSLTLAAKSGLNSNVLARNLIGREQGKAGAVRFDALFLRHYGRVHGLLRRLLGSDEAAEDAAQEVFLRLYRQESPPADDDGMGRWLTRVATNVGLNILRSDRRQMARLQRTALLERAEEPGREARQDPAQAMIAHEEARLVRAVLDGMGERARTLLILRHSGLAYAEIADALGLAHGSVGTLLARAERDFRQRYEASQGDAKAMGRS
jgi:RNA polymerase sigma-70 factor (ECF subfamily)